VGGIFYAAGVLFFGAGALAMAPVVSLFTSPIHWGVRKALKAQYGIAHEGCCPDFACVALCDPCVLCQELREIELRTAPPTMVVMSPMHQPGIMMMNMQQPQPVMAQPMMAQPMMAQPQVVLAPQPMYK
jgi:PLAC8 family